MPEFHLDKGTPESAAAFGALDSFTQGYLEAAFFTFTEDDDTAPAISGRATASIADMSPEAMARAVHDCSEFQADNAALLARAYDCDDYSPEQAGRDFWFTRNGHGVGFWSREQLPDDLGRELSDFDAATKGEVDFYRGDDGRLYFA